MLLKMPLLLCIQLNKDSKQVEYSAFIKMQCPNIPDLCFFFFNFLHSKLSEPLSEMW